MKYFRMSYEEIVFKRSYLNIILLNRSIPSYNLDNEDGERDNDRGVKKKNDFSNETELFSSLM